MFYFRYAAERVSDRPFRPACQQHPQPVFKKRSSLGQQPQDDADVGVAAAFIERVYNQNERGWHWVVALAKLRQWGNNKVVPLVPQRLVSNVSALFDCIANVLP
jgi:hypothetical protein